MFQLEFCRGMTSDNSRRQYNAYLHITSVYAQDQRLERTLELFQLHGCEKVILKKSITHSRATVITYTYCKHTQACSRTVHCAFSPELSQHYWSWCCVSKVIAGSMAAGIGFSLQMLTGHFGMPLLPPVRSSIGERGVLLAPNLSDHSTKETGVVLCASVSSAFIQPGQQVLSSGGQWMGQ